MNKKIILIAAAFVVVAVGAFALVTATTPQATDAGTQTSAQSDAKTQTNEESDAKMQTNGESDAKTQTTAGSEDAADNGDAALTSADIAAAQDLVGETMSREEVQEALGEWENFEMSSNGCERGVYAGRFYYEDFTIFSRTYDKGQTFSIVSINE